MVVLYYKLFLESFYFLLFTLLWKKYFLELILSQFPSERFGFRN